MCKNGVMQLVLVTATNEEAFHYNIIYITSQ